MAKHDLSKVWWVDGQPCGLDYRCDPDEERRVLDGFEQGGAFRSKAGRNEWRPGMPRTVIWECGNQIYVTR